MPSSVLNAEDAPKMEDSILDLSVVSAFGLAGAILGLSTLPFKDQPEEHLRNIITGGSIGLIIGVGMIAWGTAEKSQNALYGRSIWNEIESPIEQKSGTYDRLAWHKPFVDEKILKLKTYWPQFFYFTHF
tara:strand:+ start:5349 stop:5738 length:390 start_codon:yes stop_codon:yes gene_type:complete